jgi:hypothetical protein
VSTEFKMVIGMSLAYVTSFAGLLLAYYSYKKHRRGGGRKGGHA